VAFHLGRVVAALSSLRVAGSEAPGCLHGCFFAVCDLRIGPATLLLGSSGSGGRTGWRYLLAVTDCASSGHLKCGDVERWPVVVLGVCRLARL
jgi:hypothetical protein